MARSQLYLYTIVVLLLILFYFVSNLDLLDKEFQFYSDTFPQYGEIYKLLYGNGIFENILNLYGSTLIPFTVYYNCSYNIIQVPNYFNSTHVIVVDNVYNLLPSYASNNFVAFKIIDNYSISSSSTGYCIFNGYEVYNPYFNNQFEGTGNLPYYVIFYPQSIFTINDNYLNNLYNLEGNVIFQYLNNYKCIAGEIKSLSVQKMLNGISVNFLNISNAQLNNNIISVNITNNDICPIDLNNIYYDNYNIPSFGNNFNTSSNSYLIYPGQQIVGYYQYNYDDLYFCLESLGNEICIPINNLSIQYYVPITLYNNQNIPTPEPFQQDIAICNGTINIGNNFVYVNNPTLFNQINPNGQNVMFFNPNNGELFYSWYEGQLINGSTYCDVWWVNIPNGIPANSNIVIYMAIGSYNTNYYSQYYPYVGEAPYLSSTYGQYDNGNYVFNNYWNFAGTTLPNNLVCTVLSNPSGASGSCSVNNGVTIVNTNGNDFWNNYYMITYLYYNQSISIPSIVEAKVLSLTGNSGDSGWTKAGILYQNQVTTSSTSNGEVDMVVTDGKGYAIQWQSGTSYIAPSGNYNGNSIVYPTILALVFPNTSYACGFYGSSLGVLSQEGNCVTPTSMASQGYIGLLVTAHSSSGTSSAVFQYLLVRAYPPNGVMPLISTGSESSWPP
jgi:hypothetical protein